MVLEKTLESPLDCKEIQPVHSKGDQSWVFIGRTDAKAETPILWPHLNAEFQRIGRRDKKAFLSDQCKEIEENNRRGKARDLFKKIRDIKGKFHAKMGT